MAWRDHLDKLGVAGSFIAAACCLGLPAVLSIVTAIGLGFLLKDAILLPLMIVFLVVMLVGMAFGYKAHRRRWPLAIAVTSAAALFFFVFVHTWKPAAYLAIAGLVIASVFNIVFRRKCAPACEV